MRSLTLLLLLTNCVTNDATHPATFPERLSLSLEIDGRPVRLDLTKNTTLLSHDFRAQRLVDGHLEDVPFTSDPARCLYQGRPVRPGGGGPRSGDYVALSLCDGVEGLVSLGGLGWLLEPGPTPGTVRTSKLDRHRLQPVTVVPFERVEPEATHAARLALVPPVKYDEVVFVNDAARAAAQGAQTEASTLLVANVADAAYRYGNLTLPLAIVVTNIITLSADPWTVSGAPGDADFNALLTSFLDWSAMAQLGGDSRMLLSGFDFAGSTVGYADVGARCRPVRSGGISQATFSNAYVGITVAHELGHNLGMHHDGAGNACNASGFIMAPSGCSNCPQQPTMFSSCSDTYYVNWYHGPSDSSCLDDVPATSFIPRCGDGLVQTGETCDCGDSDCSVHDPCCNGSTCQLVAGALCSALDACCSPQTCMVREEGFECRGGGQCTPAATCNGVSPACPPTAFTTNGAPCDDGFTSDGGRCFYGDCRSRQAQCNSLSPLYGAMAPLVACAAQQTACGELLCGQQGNSADCTPLNSSSGYRQVAPGVPCDADSQCHDGGCVPAGSLSPCKNGQPANACGGCGTLPGTWDTPCDDGCGRLRCHSTNANALTCIPGLCAAEWLVGAFGACSQACGGGTHTRSVTCVDGETSQPVDEGHCSAPKPAESESCNTFACHDWAPGEWSGCTAACAGGTQTREVPCVSYLGVTVDDALCVTPPPATGQSCNTFACPGWLPGEWSACSVSCGGGTQSRAVPCVDALGAAVEASACATAPPPTSQSCNTVACPAWRTGAWSQCSEVCGDGTQSRSVDCAGDAGATVADAQCPAPKPAATQTCRLEACPNWQTGEWSTCPSDCGGNSTREVRCVDAAGDPTEDERCPVPRPNTEQPCDAQRCGESCGGCASTGGLGELLLGLALLALRRRR